MYALYISKYVLYYIAFYEVHVSQRGVFCCFFFLNKYDIYLVECKVIVALFILM